MKKSNFKAAKEILMERAINSNQKSCLDEAINYIASNRLQNEKYRNDKEKINKDLIEIAAAVTCLERHIKDTIDGATWDEIKGY